MDNPLADIENICFFDTETRALPGAGANGNLKTAGTYRYAQNSQVIISTWAIGSGVLFERSLDRGFEGDWLCWDEMPRELHEFHKRAEQREAWYAAFNTGFDKAVWNAGTYDFPVLAPDMVIDIMAQATASNLPPNLEGCSRVVTGRGKQDDGKELIKQFTPEDGDTPQSHPADWKRFKSYAVRDTGEARDVWKATRPLSWEEWEDYWVSETINERGVALDLPFIEKAAALADIAGDALDADLTRWTNGQVTKVTQVARLADWIYNRLGDGTVTNIMCKRWDEDPDSESGDLKVGKLSLDRGRIEALVAYLATRDNIPDDIVNALVARQYGGSTSPYKFQKMAAGHVGGRLQGQYVFSGAPQTGRYSSKGVQVHNLTRSHLGNAENEAIEFINDL